MKPICIPEDIYNLFNEKKCCIVSGGDVTKGYGAKIDSEYDVVVRLNDIHKKYPYNEEISLNYGVKCDVLFREHHCMWGMMNEYGDKNYADTLSKIGIKDVIIWDGVGSSDEMMSRMNAVSDNRFKCHKLSNESGVYELLDRKLDALPTTGLMAIALVAFSNPKSLDLYGFDFYYYLVDNNVYYPDEIRNKLPNDEVHVSHKHKKELEFFRDYLYWIANINLDSPMMNFIRARTKEKLCNLQHLEM